MKLIRMKLPPIGEHTNESVTIEIGDGPGQVTREAWETAKAIWGLTEERPADD